MSGDTFADGIAAAALYVQSVKRYIGGVEQEMTRDHLVEGIRMLGEFRAHPERFQAPFDWAALQALRKASP